MNLHRIAGFCVALAVMTAIGNTDTRAQNASKYVKSTPGASSVIVFVHGILGSKETWTHKNGTYWPDLITKDPFFSGYDVYVYEYPTRLFGAGFSIDEIAENMRLLLEADLVTNYKEIIFVSHSMGGLATRAFLNRNSKLSERVRLAFFFSTPTTGSEIASLAELISSNPHLGKMKPMQSDSYLADLQRQWLTLNNAIPSFCAYEKLATYGFNIVTQASASNLCNRRLDPIDADHLTIVKPDGLRDTPHLALKGALQSTPRKDAADGIEVREPLSITMKDNPARIGAFSDQAIYGVIPADVRTTSSPGPGCVGFHDWLKRNKGVDAGETKLQLIVQGKVAKAILLAEMRVRIIDTLPLVTGIPVVCPPAGGANYRPIEIDLDANPPRVRYEFGKKSFGFTVQAGETEVFNVVAKTTQGHYRWVIELDIVVDGNQRTIEIGNPSPFETTASKSTGHWAWDYKGSWLAEPDTPRAGVPERISAETPLPPIE
ncbi:pimeloyl-ACP methyl ester carboxylesterase [Bradyrhizobium japonicum]|uniref:Pimeloyl-ACP methyl ester carboxylesterase n=1 Tax=Bradyrhizobium japonicum TaxID=375 RepID=A0ABV2RV30_BRAJP|nr:alpha/beta hydrolase [Bradyrhizobium japonicum]UQD96003.1 hypothetical protein JEY30_31140 [Bradyrhizobium japonicum]WLB16140.1 alpha/beta hydrolase [Bradyrhizobium japonicum]